MSQSLTTPEAKNPDRSSDAATPSEVPELVEAMIAELEDLNAVRTKPVADALRAVPRWRFAPGVPLKEVYAARMAVVTKKDEHGVAISSISAPEIQAFMIEQAGIEPGMSVLEIGSGGFNAALISEVAGPDGYVMTVDIDSDVTTRAEEFLSATGYDRVDVVCADASAALPGEGQWDRIIVTVGAWDVPPAWMERLAPGGRIVVPLRMRGITRSLALEPRDGHLEAVSVEVCGFVEMQGAGSHEERLLLLHGKDVGLRFDDDNAPADIHALDGALATDRHMHSTGAITLANQSFDTLELWLAAHLPSFCLLAVSSFDAAREAGLTGEGEQHFRLAHVHGDAFAYLLTRRLGEGRFEFEVAAFGGQIEAAAALMTEQIQAWDRRRPDATQPAITIWPRQTPDAELPEGVVLDKRHTRIVLSWPDHGQDTPESKQESTKE